MYFLIIYSSQFLDFGTHDDEEEDDIFSCVIRGYSLVIFTGGMKFDGTVVKPEIRI